MTKTGIDALCEGIRDLTEERDRLREALTAALEEIERRERKEAAMGLVLIDAEERAEQAEQRVKELEERERDLLAELDSYRSLLVNEALSSEGEEE